MAYSKAPKSKIASSSPASRPIPAGSVYVSDNKTQEPKKIGNPGYKMHANKANY